MYSAPGKAAVGVAIDGEAMRRRRVRLIGRPGGGAHADLDPRRAASEASTFRRESNPVQPLPRIAEFESARERVFEDKELQFLRATLSAHTDELALTIRCIVLLGGQRFRQMLGVRRTDYDRCSPRLLGIEPQSLGRLRLRHA